MPRTVHDALAAHFDRYEVRRELHHELPHTTYEVTVDGRRAVCKVASDDRAAVGAEAAVVDHVDRTTDVPVPSILAADAEAFVAAWAHGVPDPDAVPRPDEYPESDTRALGAAMARLHEETADQFVRPGVPRFAPADDDPADADRTGDDSTDSGAAAGGRQRGRYLTVDAGENWHAVVRALLADHRDYLAGVGWADPAQTALALVEDRDDLFDGAGPPVVCHGNVFPEHVGFERDDDGAPAGLASLIDFEHALVAPAEYDFWRTALPVFHTADLEPRAGFAAFREGYESVRPLPAGVERRREAWWLVNAVTYIASVAVEHQGIGPGQRDRARGMADWVDELAAAIRDRRV